MEPFAKESILEDYLGTKMAHCSQLPTLLAIGDSISPSEGQYDIHDLYLAGPLRVCVIQVTVLQRHTPSYLQREIFLTRSTNLTLVFIRPIRLMKVWKIMKSYGRKIVKVLHPR